MKSSGFGLYPRLSRKAFAKWTEKYRAINGSVSGMINDQVSREAGLTESEARRLTKGLIRKKTSKELGLRGKNREEKLLADIKSGKFLKKQHLLTFQDIIYYIEPDANVRTRADYKMAEQLYYMVGTSSIGL